MNEKPLSPKDEKTVRIDLSRTQADKIDHIYSLMESFKNGRILSPKYESISKTFSPCHVMVMANFIPDHSKLSQDHWLVKTLKPPLKSVSSGSSMRI